MADAPAIELATAYVSLVPSAAGIQGFIASEFGSPKVAAAASAAGAKAGKSFSTRMATASKISTVALTVPLLAIGAAGLKAALDVDDAYDKIRTGTGATGKTLAGLQESFNKVARTTPADMDAVSSTVADLNTRLGLTGPTLEKLASQILEAGRLGGVDVDVKKVTGAFSAFGVEGKKTTGAMDDIFRVSQATGVPINDLASKMAKSGGILKQLGFGFKDSASLLGTLDKAGINSNAVVASMQAGLVKLAKDGEKPQDAFKRVTGELEGFVKKGDDAAALNLAGEVFGTRGAGQFIAALKSGKVNLDDLAGSAGLSKDTILGVAEETKDFPELWKEFQNTATLALAPIGETLMPAIADALQTAAPYLQKFADWFSGLDESQVKILMGVGLGLAAIGPALWVASKAQQAWTVATAVWTGVTKVATAAARALNLVLRANPIGLIITGITLLVGALVWFFTKTTVGKKIVAAAWSGIKSAIKAVADWWTETAWPAIKRVIDALGNAFRWVRDRIAGAWRGIKSAIKNVADWWTKTAWPAIKRVIDALGNAFRWVRDRIAGAWNGVRNALRAGWDWIRDNVFARLREGLNRVRDAFSTVRNGVSNAWNGMKSGLRAGFEWIRDRVFKPLRDAVFHIADSFRDVRGSIRKWWDSIKALAARPVNFVLGTVYNDGIRKWVGNIFDFFGQKNPLPKAPMIKFATGGMMPGYTPGRDVHQFYSPTGGLLELSGGEPILRPEVGRVLGRGWVDGVNASARAGGIGGVRQFLGGRQAFKDGGFWDDVGGAVSKVGGFLRNPVGAVKSGLGKLIDSLVGRIPGGKGVRSMLAGIPRKMIDGFATKLKSLFGGSGGGRGGRGGGGTFGARGVAAMTSLVKRLDPTARISSGYRPGARTASGYPSYHGMGRAIDIVSANLGRTWDLLRGAVGGSAKELYYSGRQFLRNGQVVPWRGDHWDHVHLAMKTGGIVPKLYDQGGWLPKGISMVENRTNRPEPVFTGDQFDRMVAGSGGVHVDQIIAANPRAAIQELERMERRAAVRNGMFGRTR